MLLITDLTLGSRYRVSKKPILKIIDREPGVGEYAERIEIPSGTILTVLRVNEASIRADLKFKDKDKGNRIVRIPYEGNVELYDLTSL